MTGIDLNDTVEDEEEVLLAASNSTCSPSPQSRGSSAAAGTPPRPRAAVCLELWHACAGPVAPLPRKGSVVVHLPQGHLEQLGDAAASGAAAVPPHVFCRVADVTLHVRAGLVPPAISSMSWSVGVPDD
jgi:auxin response factor